MKKTLLVAVPVLAVALLFAACDLFGGAADDYYPMTVGNMWKFQGAMTMTETDGDTLWTSTSATEVTAETQLTNGEDVFEFTNLDSTTMKMPSETTTVATAVSYARKTDDYMLAYDSKDDTEPDTVLALPLEEGKTWTVHAQGDTTITATVVAKESVTVPAGTYECWKVKTTTTFGSITTDMYWWYAEGTGRVKNYAEYSQGGYTTVMQHELVSSDIK